MHIQFIFTISVTMIWFFILFISSESIIAADFEGKNFKIELIQVLFRHGDRTPEEKEIYPTHPFDAKTYEPYGYGQLTNVGKRREYKIGEMLRQRYGHFLGETYKPNDIYAYSTDYDRTKMSLELVLASLYLPSRSLLWNYNLKWIPIPTHYNKQQLDFLSTSIVCPEYYEELDEVEKLPEVKEKILKYDSSYKYILNKTGLRAHKFTKLGEIFEVIQSHQSMGLPLPEWLTGHLYIKFRKMVELVYEIMSSTTELKKLSSGPTIKKFISNIDNQEKFNDSRKIYLYGAHDLNLSFFLKAHGLNFPKIPAYGTSIIFEKLRGPANQIYIRLLVWTGVDEQLVTLKLKDCNELCPWSEYLKIIEPVLPQGTGTECLLSRLNNNTLQDIIYKDDGLKKQ